MGKELHLLWDSPPTLLALGLPPIHLESVLLMVCCAPSQIRLSSAMLLLQTPCNPCSQDEFPTNSGQSKLLAPLRVSWTWPRMPTYGVMGSQIRGRQLQGSTGGAQLAQSVPSPILGMSHSTAPLTPLVLPSARPLAPDHLPSILITK